MLIIVSQSLSQSLQISSFVPSNRSKPKYIQFSVIEDKKTFTFKLEPENVSSFSWLVCWVVELSSCCSCETQDSMYLLLLFNIKCQFSARITRIYNRVWVCNECLLLKYEYYHIFTVTFMSDNEPNNYELWKTLDIKT